VLERAAEDGSDNQPVGLAADSASTSGQASDEAPAPVPRGSTAMIGLIAPAVEVEPRPLA
jgi:hypothetical protein